MFLQKKVFFQSYNFPRSGFPIKEGIEFQTFKIENRTFGKSKNHILHFLSYGMFQLSNLYYFFHVASLTYHTVRDSIP